MRANANTKLCSHRGSHASGLNFRRPNGYFGCRSHANKLRKIRLAPMNYVEYDECDEYENGMLDKEQHAPKPIFQSKATAEQATRTDKTAQTGFLSQSSAIFYEISLFMHELRARAPCATRWGNFPFVANKGPIRGVRMNCGQLHWLWQRKIKQIRKFIVLCVCVVATSAFVSTRKFMSAPLWPMDVARYGCKAFCTLLIYRPGTG